jgi:hypothetical protein
VAILSKDQIYRLLTEDDLPARKQFTQTFAKELLQLSALFFDALELLKNSHCAHDSTDRAGIVTSYLNLAIESAITATQLLSLGHIAPAGNTMRISYEALFTAALIKKDVNINCGRRSINFYSEYTNKSKYVKAHKIIDLAIENYQLLGLNENSKKFLEEAKKFYNGYSHAGLMFIYTKVKPSTRAFYVAGGYDAEREDQFRDQIKLVIRYSEQLQVWIKAIAYNAS